jgi:uncharacterized protein HemX
MTRRLALLSTLLVFALATPAGAQTNPFGPLPPAQPTATPTATPVKSDDGSTSKKVLFIIGAALIIGFSAMGFLIMRDARAATTDDEISQMQHRDEALHRRQKQAKVKARAKTRAQKRARRVQRGR